MFLLHSLGVNILIFLCDSEQGEVGKENEGGGVGWEGTITM